MTTAKNAHFASFAQCRQDGAPAKAKKAQILRVRADSMARTNHGQDRNPFSQQRTPRKYRARKANVYSIRRAVMGEIDAARVAGIIAAMNEHSARAPAASVSASGSHEETP